MSNNQVNFDFKPNVDNGYYLLADNVSKYDLLQADAVTGKAYKINYLDYAVCGNVTYGTAQTTFDTGKLITDTAIQGSEISADSRNGLILHSSNNIFICGNNSTTVGLSISKFNKAGELRLTVAVEGSVTSVFNNHLFELPNGNILVIYSLGSTVTFAIYDEDFNVIKSPTSVANAGSRYFSACLLSGGGFAIVYQDNGAPLTNKLVTYDNTGTIVAAATTIWTRVGTSGNQYHRMMQLSNGNLVIAVNSVNTTGAASIGLFYGIFTSAAAAVVAMTNLKTTSAVADIPNLSISSSGYFAVSKSINADGLYAWVFNNAGALQGSAFYSNTTASAAFKKIKLLTDNTDFYLLWSDSNVSKLCLTKLPVTGTNYLTTYVTLTTTNYDHLIDAFLENNAICYITLGTGAVAPQLGVIKLSNRKLISVSNTLIAGAAGTTAGSDLRVIPLGERTFVLSYTHSNTTGTHLYAGKYSQTAILGVSKSTKTAGDYADINMMPGVYRINLINTNGSSLSKAFNHSAYNFVGNKGSVNGYTVYLQGMSV